MIDIIFLVFVIAYVINYLKPDKLLESPIYFKNTQPIDSNIYTSETKKYFYQDIQNKLKDNYKKYRQHGYSKSHIMPHNFYYLELFAKRDNPWIV